MCFLMVHRRVGFINIRRENTKVTKRDQSAVLHNKLSKIFSLNNKSTHRQRIFCECDKYFHAEIKQIHH